MRQPNTNMKVSLVQRTPRVLVVVINAQPARAVAYRSSVIYCYTVLYSRTYGSRTKTRTFVEDNNAELQWRMAYSLTYISKQYLTSVNKTFFTVSSCTVMAPEFMDVTWSYITDSLQNAKSLNISKDSAVQGQWQGLVNWSSGRRNFPRGLQHCCYMATSKRTIIQRSPWTPRRCGLRTGLAARYTFQASSFGPLVLALHMQPPLCRSWIRNCFSLSYPIRGLGKHVR